MNILYYEKLNILCLKVSLNYKYIVELVARFMELYQDAYQETRIAGSETFVQRSKASYKNWGKIGQNLSCN